MTTQTNAAILEEIFIKPSNEIKTDRFACANEATAAACSGQCHSGACKSLV